MGQALEQVCIRSPPRRAPRRRGPLRPPAGLPSPVDGVTTSFSDPAVVEADTRRSASLGFTGKLCIHPQQIAAVHRGFGPTQADIDWARRVVAADDSADCRAVALNGQMVDRPVVERARAILARAS